MGVGKTLFAKSLIQNLGVEQPPEGSPTFAIAHEYHGAKIGDVVHIDLYRLRSEAEITDAGIDAYFWERNCTVLTEWLSSWPTLESAVRKRKNGYWLIKLTFSATNALALRHCQIECVRQPLK